MAERTTDNAVVARWTLLACLALPALGLLAAALAWRVPMPLWDHLDLVPIYLQWHGQGGAAGSGLWSIHGGHMHTTAYAVLLATTTLSAGEAWLDVLVSWVLLLAWLAALGWLARCGGALTWLRKPARLPWALALLLFALHPGHLSNLQWGWQVAVFLCLAGAGSSMALLVGGAVGWMRNTGALAAALLACLSFATGMAVIPVAILLVLARPQQAPRGWLLLPWMLLAGWAVFHHAAATPSVAPPVVYALYVLNYLGAGVSRFSLEAAPWLAAASLLPVMLAAMRGWRRPDMQAWLALSGFAMGCAVLTAIGRAGALGSEHAFVSRYVSFSSVYWVGWCGLMVTYLRDRVQVPWARAAVAVLLVFGVANGIHMISQAYQLGVSSRQTAVEIACSWPEVDRETLARIYFDRPSVARERLAQLQGLGFPPFDGSVACTTSVQ